MFLKRVKIQFKQLEVLMASLKKRKHYADQSGSKGNQEIARDQFGLAKVIIAVTESGKIFALDSLSKFVSISYCCIFINVLP